ncbi:unnamed protein product [Mytilus coruscus]|uniref:Peptidase A2 domain-containing protein n=1 Tax=Mytilus coruscus TaxID=42192 RepID=A0A6J8DMB1_MYTCO|nr:unnamed protein product [Mytilus coruscus]
MFESESQGEESGEDGEQTLCYDSPNSDLEGDLIAEGEKEMVTISRLTSGTMYRVPVVVQDQKVDAVVDTAAQVTLISEELYKSLKKPPLPPSPLPILKEVDMKTVGKGLQMNGFVSGPFQVGLGTQEYTWDIYVAPIGDQMLLGIDFLREQGISLDLHRNQLSIHGEVVQMSWGQAKVLPQTTEVRAGKNHMVPANSGKRVIGVLAEPMGREYIIEARAEGNPLIPRTLHEMGQDPMLCLINLSDSSLAITKGDLLAQAQEVDVRGYQGPKVCKMGVAENSNEKELPQHLQEMFRRSCADLSEGEEETLCSLLKEFQDFTVNVDDTIPLAKKSARVKQTRGTPEQAVQISRVSVSRMGDELAIWTEGEGDIWVQEIGEDPGVNLGASQEELLGNQGATSAGNGFMDDVRITPEGAEQMDAYQCPGCSASTGVHVSMVILHSQVNLFQIDQKEQPEKQASGDGSPPSSLLQPSITEEILIVTVPEEELRGLDPEVLGNSGPPVKVGGEGGIPGEGGESEGGFEDATGGAGGGGRDGGGEEEEEEKEPE